MYLTCKNNVKSPGYIERRPRLNKPKSQETRLGDSILHLFVLGNGEDLDHTQTKNAIALLVVVVVAAVAVAV